MLAPQPNQPNTQQPVKLACATCIQGHRASTCKHQDGSKGPLLVVKRRGRPLSQCQSCREKRSRTGRHTRCICDARPGNAKGTTAPVSAANTAAATVATAPAPGLDTRETSAASAASPLSFANLLNPCRCKTTGICTCCNTNSFDSNGVPSCKPNAENDCSPSCGSCTDACKESTKNAARATRSPSQYMPRPIMPAMPAMPAPKREAAGCCRPRVAEVDLPSKRPKQDSMSLLAQAADMSRPFKPSCNCGPNCKCAGCYERTLRSNRPSSLYPRPSDTKPDCNSCGACDIQLTGPSGIDQVDRWFSADKLSTATK